MLLSLVLLAVSALAEVPDIALAALEDKGVVLERADGTEVEGRLIGFDVAQIVVELGNGKVVAIDRLTIEGIRVQGQAEPEPVLGVPEPPPATAPLVVAPVGEDDPKAQLLELRVMQQHQQSSAMVNLLLAFPASLAVFGAGWWYMDEYAITGNGADLTMATLGLTVGGVGAVMTPVAGIVQANSAADYRRQADALEASLAGGSVSKVRVVLLPDVQRTGGGVRIAGQF